jgi:hypothetical protein
MPGQPTWIESVPQILETLEAPGSPPFLDRPAVEKLFGIRRRQAIHLLRRCGGFLVGKTFLVPRETMLQFLRDPQQQTAAQDEQGRFERLTAVLGEARADLHQKRVPIPAVKETLRLELSGLPAGIRLEPSQLTVEFQRPTELLEKLFALSQALANDYESFERSWMAASRTGDLP